MVAVTSWIPAILVLVLVAVTTFEAAGEDSAIVKEKETLAQQCEELVKRSADDCWETLVELRWNLEVARRNLEAELTRPLYDIALDRMQKWVAVRKDETERALESARNFLKIKIDYAEKTVKEFDVAVWQRSVQDTMSNLSRASSKGFNTLTTAAGKYLWIFATEVTAAKLNAERHLLIYLNRELPKDLLPYADQIVAMVFVGIPAFILAVIWHTLTSKIQRCCGRLIFRGRGAEFYEDDAARQQHPARERPTRLGRD